MDETAATDERIGSDESARDLGDAMGTLSESMDGLSDELTALNEAVVALQATTCRASDHQRAVSTSLSRAAETLSGDAPTPTPRAGRDGSATAASSAVADD
ncbi:hypothetical protein EGH21_07165 [Halomicroarcula sp. F13]|uniref:Uncharacterized protein n=1 Tax=Haloarcula rubra TaxID=2487747 RepID=A0AAW4PML3_9EURY|nr:hypothetical protein [Halomicroarcula rubra]MBX0322808.1 hypothetical protein [Halomicroarcula rubra]